VVSFIGSFTVAVILGLLPLAYSFKRPADAPLTWGEAMAAALYVMFSFFWANVIVAQQWLNLATSEWKWGPTQILLGPHNGLVHPPFTITRSTLSDIILLLIYGFFLNLQIAVWIIWQTRGKRQKTESTVRQSSFGRPVAKRV
jgi:hypothetical protein